MKTVLTIIVAAAVGLIFGFIGGAICLILYTMHRENKTGE